MCKVINLFQANIINVNAPMFVLIDIEVIFKIKYPFGFYFWTNCI